MYQENSEEELKAMQTYGFGSLRSGVFARLQVSLCILRAVPRLVSRFLPSGDFFTNCLRFTNKSSLIR